MVVSLGPGKFYGTSLPRPWIYVKVNGHRVDPPAPFNDPLMSWAQEAHWSMGGLSFKRLRLQGKIEGNVERLRSQREKLQAQSPPARSVLAGSKRAASPLTPPAPVATKRRRYMDLNLIQEEEEEKEEEEKEEVVVRRTSVRKNRLVKKLGDDFDRVASLENDDDSDTLSFKTRTRKLVKNGEPVKKTVSAEVTEKSNPKVKKSTSEAEKSPRVRTSPRLAKRFSN